MSVYLIPSLESVKSDKFISYCDKRNIEIYQVQSDAQIRDLSRTSPDFVLIYRDQNKIISFPGDNVWQQVKKAGLESKDPGNFYFVNKEKFAEHFSTHLKASLIAETPKAPKEKISLIVKTSSAPKRKSSLIESFGKFISELSGRLSPEVSNQNGGTSPRACIGCRR